MDFDYSAEYQIVKIIKMSNILPIARYQIVTKYTLILGSNLVLGLLPTSNNNIIYTNVHGNSVNLKILPLEVYN